MRRINDLSVALTEVGMWAKVKIDVNGNLVRGLLGRVSDSDFCFASNEIRLDGYDSFRGSSCSWDSFIEGFRFKWSISVSACGTCALQEIITRRSFDTVLNISFLGLITEDHHFIPFEGITTTSCEPTHVVNEMAFYHKNYEKSTKYTGIHGYHYHHGSIQNAPLVNGRGHKIGVELEIEFNSSSMKSNWADNVESNWFYCERDGSLNDSTGVEIITVPMLPKDIKNRTTWEPLIGYLANKAKSWDSPRCGLHVHIGREILGKNPEQQSETIGKLLYLYHHHVNGTDMNTKIFGRSRAYNEKDGKTREGDAVATLGSGVLKLKEIKDTLKKGMIEKSSDDRYFDINLMNTNTIEFRKGRGSIKTSRIIMVIEYCEMMCKYAKSAKWDEINKANFVDYVVKNISKESPLFCFFEAGERCDMSF